MVCNRCIMVVEDILKQVGIVPIAVNMGEVILQEPLNDTIKEDLKNRLESVGFELIDNKKIRLIEKIKNAIIKLVRQDNNDLKSNNLSDYIVEEVNLDYTYVSNLFSEIENTTIEKYFILQKIERVKELLVYDELSLSQIAFLLNYSSTAHLSTQFKKITGLTPSHFKQIKENKRKPLDKV